MTPLSALLVLSTAGDPVPEAKDVTPGWIYAAVFFAMCGLTLLLWFSMRKQLGKIHFGDKAHDSAQPTPKQQAGEKQDPPTSV